MNCVYPNCKEPRSREYHCKPHSIEARNYCAQYKEFQEKYLSDILDIGLNLDGLTMKQVLRKYQLLGQLYSMRNKYKNRFFRPEYDDRM